MSGFRKAGMGKHGKTWENMGKRTTVKTPDPEVVILDSKEISTEVILTSKPSALVSLIEAGQLDVISTERLVPFYVQADAVKKRIEKLLAKVKLAIVDRRDEGVPTGDKQQHRLFAYDSPLGHCEIQVQEKRSWTPNLEKLTVLLKRKKLWDAATDLRITTSGDAFQKFLRKNSRSLRDMGVEIVEELNHEKVDGLCQAKLITTDELEAILDKPEPTHAVVPKLVR
jgi:hypothetical protein